MKRVLIGLVALLLLGGVAVFVALGNPSVQDGLLERAVAARAGAAPLLPAPDRLEVLFCGTGSPLPDETRGASCLLVLAGERMILVDAGPGAWQGLNRAAVPLGGLSAVLLTHFHSDHVGGLGEVTLYSWIGGRKAPLPVYGPPGVERIAEGFNTVYALDSVYRTAHHGAELLPPDATGLESRTVPMPGEEGRLVLSEGKLEIVAFRVDHSPVEPAYGYRIVYGDRALVVSGDTVKHPNMARFGRGADLMIHEALARHMVAGMADALEGAGALANAKLLRDTIDYHTSPVEAAESANEAGVPWLLYTHVVPPLPNAVMRRSFLRGVAAVRPEGVRIAEDGLLVSLPLGSEAVGFSMRP
ncbi:MAG: MBL fold metallo-hydrolase [Alphaproteobacteria bacterium]|nr:MBL fold metallo-hydrolase [Alphaproteobacteria bacterium]